MNTIGSGFQGIHIPAHAVTPGPMDHFDYGGSGSILAVPNIHNWMQAAHDSEAVHMIVYNTKAG